MMYIPVSQAPDGITALELSSPAAAIAVRTQVSPFSLSQQIQQALQRLHRRAAGGAHPLDGSGEGRIHVA